MEPYIFNAHHKLTTQRKLLTNFELLPFSMPEKKQIGAILPITLILLLMMTVLGITAISSGLYQGKMSGNMRDQYRAFESAEVGLAEAEDWLLALITLPATSSTCSSTPCVLSVDPNRYPETQSAAWWAVNGASASASLPYTATQPQYTLEYQRFVADDSTLGLGYVPSGVHFYRITAQGNGITNTSQSTLQATVARRF